MPRKRRLSDSGHPGGAAKRRRSTLQLRQRLFDEALGVLAREVARHVTVADVARRIATSQRQLQRAFAEAGGASFSAYLTRIRMARASQLLASTELPVKEVAKRVGYREPSQFTKAFKRAYGLTPSGYRERNRRSPKPG